MTVPGKSFSFSLHGLYFKRSFHLKLIQFSHVFKLFVPLTRICLAQGVVMSDDKFCGPARMTKTYENS